MRVHATCSTYSPLSRGRYIAEGMHAVCSVGVVTEGSCFFGEKFHRHVVRGGGDGGGAFNLSSPTSTPSARRAAPLLPRRYRARKSLQANSRFRARALLNFFFVRIADPSPFQPVLPRPCVAFVGFYAFQSLALPNSNTPCFFGEM